MSSHLDFEGKYNPDKRFVISNWTTEDFKSFWDGRPISIKAGDMYECEHAIAYKLTKEIVDREMFRDAEASMQGANDFQSREKLRERGEMATLNPDKRKPYEDKTITEIMAGQENPITAKLREEIRAEERAKIQISNEKAVDNTPLEVTETGAVPFDTATESTPKKKAKKADTEFADSN